MQSHNMSSVVVSEPGEPVSILTEQDLTRALAEDCEPGMRVAAFASPRPVTIRADATVTDAASLMLREGIRHLVVTHGGRAVGVVSTRDLLTVLAETVASDMALPTLQRFVGDTAESWFG